MAPYFLQTPLFTCLSSITWCKFFLSLFYSCNRFYDLTHCIKQCLLYFLECLLPGFKLSLSFQKFKITFINSTHLLSLYFVPHDLYIWGNPFSLVVTNIKNFPSFCTLENCIRFRAKSKKCFPSFVSMTLDTQHLIDLYCSKEGLAIQ